MKKKIIAGAIALLLGGAGALVVAGPASAHTPTASATCEAVYIDASYYDGTRPSEGEPTIEVANPDYVPAHPGSPAVGEPQIEVANPDYVPAKDAVYETVVTEREYKKLHPLDGWQYQWFPADATPGGWEATGEVKTAEVQVSPAQPAVGTPTIVIDNPDYQPEVPATEAQGEPTIVIANPDYVPASDEANHVTATIDGAVVLDESFGSSFSDEIAIETKHLAHDWSVTITAWNDPTGSKGWTKTISGTTTPCIAPQPEEKVTIGEWSEPIVTCDSEVGDEQTVTREVTTTPYVLVDGLWVLNPANAEVTTEEATYVVTAEDIEALECEVVTPPTEEPPTTEPPATEPPAEVPTPAPSAARTSTDALAETGLPSMLGYGVAALALMVAGAAGVLVRRRRA